MTTRLHTPEHERRYLTFIRDSIDRIRRYLPGTEEGFIATEAVQDAVVWRLQIVGDAARSHLSDDLKARHSEIRWEAIYGFRNIAAHDYAGIDLIVVWRIVTEHLDELYAVVTEELGG